MQIGNFGNENAIRNTSARMANVLAGSEIEKITVGKFRDVGGKLYNLEEEVEISENELIKLNNRKEVAEKEEEEEISVMQEEKEQKI